MPGPNDDLREALRNLLSGDLPGAEAHRAAWPDHLPGRADPLEAARYAAAAVLLAIHPTNGSFLFPLIRRPEGTGPHAGQISLPGGECLSAEDPARCALREAEEEVGLAARRVEVLGLLTPVNVSVSRYTIRPVVGWVESRAPWALQCAEVAAVLEADADRLAAEGLRGVLRRERDGLRFEAPCYVLVDPMGPEAQIWGATAIVLAEFLSVWTKARRMAAPQA